MNAGIAFGQLLSMALWLQRDCAAAEDQAAPGTAAPPVATWRLTEPFWSSPIVYAESSLFVADGDSHVPSSRLLRVPKRVLKVARADGAETFDEGKDYRVDAEGRLTAPPGSRIPFLEPADFFPPKGAPRSIGDKAGDPSRAVLFDNGHWFHDQQVEITYEAAQPWSGFQPATSGGSLRRVLGKLAAREPVTIAVSGDSISAGLNASGVTGAAPHMPAFPELLADQLAATFGGKVTLVNRAVGGWGVGQGLDDLAKLLESHPDLVIVAYGMNHFGGRNPEAFRKGLSTMLERIKVAEPQAEVLLVAPMWGNSDWVHTPADQFQPHRDAIASLVGPQVALADLTTLWGDMRSRKSNADLTGNGVNHPNDFGHRVHAAALFSQLVGPDGAK
jgi:lysophospholipase L1-like esterase